MISILLTFITDKGRAFQSAFGLLNVAYIEMKRDTVLMEGHERLGCNSVPTQYIIIMFVSQTRGGRYIDLYFIPTEAVSNGV